MVRTLSGQRLRPIRHKGIRLLLAPVAARYGGWIGRRENDLCFRATDRTVRPFEYGLEWSKAWSCSHEFRSDRLHPLEHITRLNERAIENSHEFFGYKTPGKFELNEDWLEFVSPVETPYAENNVVRAAWFPAMNDSGKAVVVLPHWNAALPQHNSLCAGLRRIGISALRLSLPYHDRRMPAGLRRADYAVSSNVCRTIDAARQAVIDTRCCVDWLEQQGFHDVGIVGTSLGSCYAFLASAHDSRLRVNVFNHCSTYFADVVWEGLSTRHIRQGLEGQVRLEMLRKLWLCISPPSYWGLFSDPKKKSKFIYGRYDTTFPLQLSRQVIEGARKHNWPHEVSVLPCGHYTMGDFPFNFITGYEICRFLKRNL